MLAAAAPGAEGHVLTLRGATTEVTPGAVRYLARSGTYSIEKARSVLGYHPTISLVEGMARCEEWLHAEELLRPGHGISRGQRRS